MDAQRGIADAKADAPRRYLFLVVPGKGRERAHPERDAVILQTADLDELASQQQQHPPTCVDARGLVLSLMDRHVIGKDPERRVDDRVGHTSAAKELPSDPRAKGKD